MVFNTGMTGYQETLTDPSYARQIVAMTAPHIGNTGVNDEDPESRRIWVSGYVVREPARLASNWRSQRSLDAELRAQGITGIAITGTRALTRHLRDRGAMRAGIATGTADAGRAPRAGAGQPADGRRGPGPGGVHGRRLHRGPAGRRGVSATRSRPWTWASRPPRRWPWPGAAARSPCSRRPAPPRKSWPPGPDGVFFSNGPATRPRPATRWTRSAGVLARGVPVFGICLGSQVLGRALGLGTYKLRFGHRGVNQPVKDLATGRVQITSHNHGFAVAMPDGAEGTATRVPGATFGTDFGPAQITHVNLNDGVVEGLRLLDRPAFSVQYHPEAAPGPHDASGLFDEILRPDGWSQGRCACPGVRTCGRCS